MDEYGISSPPSTADTRRLVVDNQTMVKGPINPFVIGEKKRYLLLFRVQWEDEEYSYEWYIAEGQQYARQICIDHIDHIDPLNSYVFVEGNTLSLKKEDMVTVYRLFSDPKSAWADKNKYPDSFDIHDYVVVDSQDEINEAMASSPQTANIMTPSEYEDFLLQKDFYKGGS